MTRRALRGVAAAVGAACVCPLAVPMELHGQGEVAATECCGEFLYTIGGRAQSLGNAIGARSAAASMFVNPALLALVSDDQFMVHNAETEIENSNTFSVIIRSDVAGTFGLSYRLVDYGTQDKLNNDGIPVGSFRTLRHVLTASYATDVVAGLNAGVNYKLFQSRRDCSGFCDDVSSTPATTHGVDLGVQYIPARMPTLAVGASVVNLGFPLQFVNAEQASPMPVRLRFGAAYEAGHHFLADSAIAVWTSTDVVVNPREGDMHLNVGVDVSVEEIIFVRAGYGGSGAFTGGAAAGVGIHYDRFVVDIARSFASSPLDDEPVQISFAIKF